jgi:hypothetical protein
MEKPGSAFQIRKAGKPEQPQVFSKQELQVRSQVFKIFGSDLSGTQKTGNRCI